MPWNERPACRLPDIPDLIDWSERGTTVDQTAIEEVLEGMIEPSTQLLHVGIGNSSLARSFASRCARITGFSVSAREVAHARSLAIPNYELVEINKYAVDYAHHQNEFSLIVDNNPNSYACCWEHFILLLQGYRMALMPQGYFITHARGLAWVRRGLDPKVWKFDEERFRALALRAGFRGIERLGNDAYLVRRDERIA